MRNNDKQGATTSGEQQQMRNNNGWGVVIGGEWACVGKNNHRQIQARAPMHKQEQQHVNEGQSNDMQVRAETMTHKRK